MFTRLSTEKVISNHFPELDSMNSDDSTRLIQEEGLKNEIPFHLHSLDNLINFIEQKPDDAVQTAFAVLGERLTLNIVKNVRGLSTLCEGLSPSKIKLILPFLQHLLKNVDDVEVVFRKLTLEQREPILIATILTPPERLTTMPMGRILLVKLLGWCRTPEQRTLVLTAVEKKLAIIIRTSHDLIAVLQACDTPEQRKLVLIAVEKQLKNLTFTRENFLCFLKVTDEQAHLKIIIQLQSYAHTFNYTHDSLSEILSLLDTQAAKVFLTSIQGKLPQIIQNLDLWKISVGDKVEKHVFIIEKLFRENTSLGFDDPRLIIVNVGSLENKLTQYIEKKRTLADYYFLANKPIKRELAKYALDCLKNKTSFNLMEKYPDQNTRAMAKRALNEGLLGIIMQNDEAQQLLQEKQDENITYALELDRTQSTL